MHHRHRKQSHLQMRQRLEIAITSLVLVITISLSFCSKSFAAEVSIPPTQSFSNLEAKQSYSYSDAEKLAMAQVVYAEANGESLRGQTAVAAVILNRFFGNDPYYMHDSILNLINQPGQFAKCSLSRDTILKLSPGCIEAVELAILGYDPTAEIFEHGALFYGADWKHGVYGQTSIHQRSSDGATLMVIDRQAYRIVF